MRMKFIWSITTAIVVSFTHCFSQQFEKITDTPITNSALGSRAATFVDVNNDDLIDVFITNGPSGGQNNSLYINQGNGEFIEDTESIIANDDSPSDGATWGDIDNDGDIDLYVVNWYGVSNLLYLNEGGGDFRKVTGVGMPSRGHSETASWADYNKDGYLDLYVANSGGESNDFLSSDGDGNYTKIVSTTNSALNNTRSVNWIDFDNDNDLDLFISNEGSEKNKLYVNTNGEFDLYDNGQISNDSENSTGSSWADYDNDGDLDLYVANFNQKNSFYRNDGNSFTKLNSTGLTDEANYSFGTTWGDIDNDGDLDLFVVDASFDTNIQKPNSLYINNGNDTFTKVTDSYMTSQLGWSFGAAFGDYDKDGFLDLIVARTYNEGQSNLLYHNLGNSNNWINIKCKGTVSNKSAIGAKVTATAIIGGVEVSQLREVSSQSGYNCQNSLNVHFGLGDATLITKLVIQWPSGNTETFDNLSANDFYTFEEKIPDDFLRANFKVENKEYEFNEDVQFKNLSLVDPNQEVTYEWDFDNDGIVDSNDLEPSFTYPNAGTYDIELVISNANNSNAITREGYITINEEKIVEITGVQEFADASVKIFPNPSDNIIRIESSSIKINKVDIFDLQGTYVRSNNLHEINFNSYSANIKNLSKGMFFVQVLLDNGEIVRQKIIKR